MSGGEILRAALKACLEQARANAGAIADQAPRGHSGEDSIHQLRIGLRRLRTAARELGGLDPGFAAPWEPALATAFRALGAYRDRESVVPAIERRLRDAGSPRPILLIDAPEPPDPVAVVSEPAFQCALLDVQAEVLKHRDAPAVATDDDGGRHGACDAASLRRIDARLSKLRRRLRRGARDFAHLDEPGQHRVRKRLKRLRYLAELVGPLYADAKVERFLERLRPAQDALGAHVDLIVGQRMARSAAEAGDTLAWFNVGWLAAQLPDSTRRCARALRRAARAPGFW